MTFTLTCENTDRIQKHNDAMDTIQESLSAIKKALKELNPRQIKNPLDRISNLSRTINSATIQFGILNSMSGDDEIDTDANGNSISYFNKEVK